MSFVNKIVKLWRAICVKEEWFKWSRTDRHTLHLQQEMVIAMVTDRHLTQPAVMSMDGHICPSELDGCKSGDFKDEVKLSVLV